MRKVVLVFALLALAFPASAREERFTDVAPPHLYAEAAVALDEMHRTFVAYVIEHGGKCAGPSAIEALPDRTHLYCADGYAYTKRRDGKVLRFSEW